MKPAKKKSKVKFTSKWTTLLKSCVNAEAEVEHLQGVVAEQTAKIEDLQEIQMQGIETHARLIGKLAESERENTTLKNTLVTVRNAANQVVDLKHTLGTLQTENATYLSQIERYKIYVSDANVLINDAKVVANSLREEVAAHKSNTELLAKKILQLDANLRIALDDVEHFKTRNKNNRGALSKIERGAFFTHKGIATSALNADEDSSVRYAKAKQYVAA